MLEVILTVVDYPGCMAQWSVDAAGNLACFPGRTMGSKHQSKV